MKRKHFNYYISDFWTFIKNQAAFIIQAMSDFKKEINLEEERMS